jgi:hypothetical protein
MTLSRKVCSTCEQCLAILFYPVQPARSKNPPTDYVNIAYLFVFYLTTLVSNSDYITSYDWMLVNHELEECERNRRWPNVR